ncbi:MAG: hypothetical protein M5U27_06125 [Gaiella sp.]|nr:hypothetical protein [Gaiella sp.]
MRLSLYHFDTGVQTIGGNRVVYDVERGAARFGAASVDGPALVWQLDHDEVDAEGALLSRFVQLDPYASWVVRCDRIDFPRGAVVPAHTHPGPAILYVLHGEVEVEADGRASFFGPGGAWFESGPDAVLTRASSHLGASCVRALVLPAEWAGKRPVRFVEGAAAEDAGETVAVLLEHAIALPR